MHSLLFLSARQLVQNEEAICEALEYLPRELYSVLFKVAFRENKTMLLHALVKMWPYSYLKVQMLLHSCYRCRWIYSKKCPDCQWILTHNELNKKKLYIIIKGVISYMRKSISDGSKQRQDRRIQQLDMTGLLGKQFIWNLKLTRLWASSISRARVYISSQQEICDPKIQAKDQVAESSSVTFPVEARVDLLVDLQVSSSSRKFLKAALLENANSPLHLTCRDFYNAYLPVEDAVELLVLLNTQTLRRLDLSFSIIKLLEIGWLMSQITIFENMQSLKLPHFNEDVHWWMEPNLKAEFDIFAAELKKLRQLREIAFHSICLSNHLEYLLRDLQCPLESLQLSSCYLTNKDLSFLAQSHHTSHLIKLDLSGNNITNYLASFLELVKSASDSLMWLNVTRCKLQDTDIYEALPYLCCCTRLSHLGLYGNPMSSTSMLVFLRQCQYKLPNLKVISIPIFLNCCKNLPQHYPLPKSLEPYIDDEKLSSVLNEMKKLPIARGESPVEYTFDYYFDTSDYFDL